LEQSSALKRKALFLPLHREPRAASAHRVVTARVVGIVLSDAARSMAGQFTVAGVARTLRNRFELKRRGVSRIGAGRCEESRVRSVGCGWRSNAKRHIQTSCPALITSAEPVLLFRGATGKAPADRGHLREEPDRASFREERSAPARKVRPRG
jgi:hypothetical protein